MSDTDFNSLNIDYEENEREDFGNIKNSVHRKQKERKLRKKRKKANRLKSFLRFILFGLLLFLIYEFFKLPGWYLPADTFKNPALNRIETVNNQIVPTYIINQQLKNVKVPKLPIFLYGVKPIKKELFKNPVIKKIYVRRYGFPARIQIIVQERAPIAIIKTDLKNKPSAYFTNDGVLINYKKYMNLEDDPTILKILTTPQSLKKEISVKRVREIEKIVKAVETYSDEKVEYIDIRNSNDVYVKIKTTSLRLGTLDSTVFERIKRIYTILPQISEVNSKVKYIDLSWDKVNYLKLDKNKK